jgi:hypothetical protein
MANLTQHTKNIQAMLIPVALAGLGYDIETLLNVKHATAIQDMAHFYMIVVFGAFSFAISIILILWLGFVDNDDRLIIGGLALGSTIQGILATVNAVAYWRLQPTLALDSMLVFQSFVILGGAWIIHRNNQRLRTGKAFLNELSQFYAIQQQLIDHISQSSAVPNLGSLPPIISSLEQLALRLAATSPNETFHDLYEGYQEGMADVQKLLETPGSPGGEGKIYTRLMEVGKKFAKGLAAAAKTNEQ